jgi:two-component system sensor histidine kinase BaeS
LIGKGIFLVRLSIRLKLFLSILLALLCTIFLLASLVKLKVEYGFLHYLGERDKTVLSQLAQDLSRYYETNNQFPDDTQRGIWQSWLVDALHLPPVVNEKEKHKRIEFISKRIVLLDENKQVIQGIAADKHALSDLLPIQVNQHVVGYVTMQMRQGVGEKLEHEFNQQFVRNLGLIVIVTLLVALILAWLLSRHFGYPIQALRRASQALSEGNYRERVQVTGSDELSALANDMNALAERLEENEATRKRWVADIAHELRTPLTILKGEVEALQDGISQPDEAKFKSLHDEVTQLQRLVDDLYQLSLSDSGVLSYTMQPIDLARLLQDVVMSYLPIFQERQLQLSLTEALPVACIVMADEQRLKQLLNNLFENTLRYTDAGGCLQVALRVHGSQAQIQLDDSAPSVPDSALPYLFDRLYRVEASRNRATGGAGLGLSIAQAIAQAHHGALTATHAALGGLSICLVLPILQE